MIQHIQSFAIFVTNLDHGILQRANISVERDETGVRHAFQRDGVEHVGASAADADDTNRRSSVSARGCGFEFEFDHKPGSDVIGCEDVLRVYPRMALQSREPLKSVLSFSVSRANGGKFGTAGKIEKKLPLGTIRNRQLYSDRQ